MQKKSKVTATAGDWAASTTGQRLPQDYHRANRKVGSIRNGLINYTQDMKYFEGADSHKVRHTVDEDATHIKDTIDRDILVTKAP